MSERLLRGLRKARDKARERRSESEDSSESLPASLQQLDLSSEDQSLATAGTSLCEPCAAVDFHKLRSPTVSELRKFRNGIVPLGNWPFIKFGEFGDEWKFTMGLQSRIDESAKTCPLCDALSDAYHNHGPKKEVSERGIQDPVCEIDIELCSRMLPLEGVRYFRESGSRSVFVDNIDDNFFYHLRRINLCWRRLGPEEDPATNKWTKNPERKSAYLYEYFQIYDGQSDNVERDQLFNDKRLEPFRYCFGGRKRPSSIDLKLPLNWLRECRDHHGDTCERQSAAAAAASVPTHTKLFRLIDVVDRCIVEHHDVDFKDLEYITLSYVWGPVQRLKMLKENKAMLQEPGALRGKVATTIEDSINFVEGLGMRYLWVDAVCIVQDDDNDKALQIGQMSSIYAFGLLTVVAAAGTNSESGLPGLRAPRTATQREVPLPRSSARKPGFNLITTLDPQDGQFLHSLSTTVWGTRGWTLQERVLSRRVLSFSDQQLYWSCRKSNWREDTYLECPLARLVFHSDQHEAFLDPSVRLMNRPLDLRIQLWYQLCQLVQKFSARNLTVDGDIYDAFTAILQEFSHETGEVFLWGLPATRFELGLCWEPLRVGLQRRTALTTLPSTTLNRKVPFPSWSWVGWHGQICLRLDDEDYSLGFRSVITCYILRRQPLRVLPVREVVYDGTDQQPPGWYRHDEQSEVQLADIEEQCPELPDLAGIPDDQLVFFWAETATFDLFGPIEEEVYERRETLHRSVYEIRRDGKTVGRTHPCNLEAAEAGRQTTRPAEFVLIAMGDLPIPPRPMIVLQVQRREGRCYRVNIGDIEEDEWFAAEREMELIALG